MESFGMNFIKYVLFVFNLIFAISGIGIIAAGAVVLADVGEIYDFTESRILAPPVVLIVAGAIVFLIAFLGCFGAIRESRSMLMAFAVGLLIIFILELAAGIAAACYQNDFEKGLKTTLKESMKNYSTIEAERKTWDDIQNKLKCCGVDGHQDFQGQSVPLSCCHDEQENGESESASCKGFQQGANYVNTIGCFEKLHTKITSNSKILIGVGIGIAFIEIIGIVLACWLAMAIKRENGGNKEVN